jgi:hypothetical protein
MCQCLSIAYPDLENIPTGPSGPAGFNMKFKLFEECRDAVASSGDCAGAEKGRMYCILLVAAADRASRPGAPSN